MTIKINASTDKIRRASATPPFEDNNNSSFSSQFLMGSIHNGMATAAAHNMKYEDAFAPGSSSEHQTSVFVIPPADQHEESVSIG